MIKMKDEKIKKEINDFKKFLKSSDYLIDYTADMRDVFSPDMFLGSLPTIEQSYYGGIHSSNKASKKNIDNTRLIHLKKVLSFDLTKYKKNINILRNHNIEINKKSFMNCYDDFVSLVNKRNDLRDTKRQLENKISPLIENVSYRKQEIGTVELNGNTKEVAIAKYGLGLKEKYRSIFRAVNKEELLYLLLMFGQSIEEKATNSASKNSVSKLNKYLPLLKGMFGKGIKMYEEITKEISNRKIMYLDYYNTERYREYNVTQATLELGENYLRYVFKTKEQKVGTKSWRQPDDKIVLEYEGSETDFIVNEQLKDIILDLNSEMKNKLSSYIKHNKDIMEKIFSETEKHRVVLEIKNNLTN